MEVCRDRLANIHLPYIFDSLFFFLSWHHSNHFSIPFSIIGAITSFRLWPVLSYYCIRNFINQSQQPHMLRSDRISNALIPLSYFAIPTSLLNDSMHQSGVCNINRRSLAAHKAWSRWSALYTVSCSRYLFNMSHSFLHIIRLLQKCYPNIDIHLN